MDASATSFSDSEKLLGRWSSGRDVLTTASLLLLANSVLRGVRAPGRFPYTHLLFNYQFGFSKRALLGTIISTLNITALYHYSFFFWFSVSIFSGILVLLVRQIVALRKADVTQGKYIALVFSSSMAIVFMAHTMGYLEQVSLLLTLWLIGIRGFYLRILLTLVLFPISLLIHESGFLLFFPALLFRFFADLAVLSEWRSRMALGATVAVVVATVLILSQARLSDAAATAMYHAVQAKADYPLRRDAFIMTVVGSYDSLVMTLASWRSPSMRAYFLYSTVVTLPTTLYIVWSSIKMLLARGYDWRMGSLVICASVAPLALNVLGFDFARWAALATTSSFLVFCVATLYLPVKIGQKESRYVGSLVTACALVALNLSSTIPLFDGYGVNNFPYGEQLEEFLGVTKGTKSFPPEPAQCEEQGCVKAIDGQCSRSAMIPAEFLKPNHGMLDCVDESLKVDPWSVRIARFLAQP